MATTWSRKRRGKRIRNNRWTRTDALAARRVLRDCYRARTRLATADNVTDRRLAWVLTMTLLRVVGHVLRKVDGKRSPHLATAIRSTYASWKAHPAAHIIFHEFIEKERNEVIKEYQIARAATAGEVAIEGLPELLLIGNQALSADAAIGCALKWWEHQLNDIEESAASMLAGTR